LKIIASNFKTNHTRKSTKEFVDEVDNYLQNENIQNDVYIFPPATALDDFETVSNLEVGTQNSYYAKNGSFTGEIGTEQLEEFNIKTILIGHSERRHKLENLVFEILLLQVVVHLLEVFYHFVNLILHLMLNYFQVHQLYQILAS
jgi:triosephosphate isomerase (TIM)